MRLAGVCQSHTYESQSILDKTAHYATYVDGSKNLKCFGIYSLKIQGGVSAPPVCSILVKLELLFLDSH